jgi:hypothetical protein
MKPFRHRRLRSRISLLAICALLWSQMLLALHADCLSPAMTGVPSAAVAEHHDCADADDAAHSVVCASHCSQGEASPDSPRAPSVPPLALVAIMPMVDAEGLLPPSPSTRPGRTGSGWHRPTPHPAKVLLI